MNFIRNFVLSYSLTLISYNSFVKTVIVTRNPTRYTLIVKTIEFWQLITVKITKLDCIVTHSKKCSIWVPFKESKFMKIAIYSFLFLIWLFRFFYSFNWDSYSCFWSYNYLFETFLSFPSQTIISIIDQETDILSVWRLFWLYPFFLFFQFMYIKPSILLLKTSIGP